MTDVFGIEDVVSRGLCIGCGGCSVRTSGKVSVTLGRYGVMQADLTQATPDDIEAASRVCPMSDHAKNESTLAAERFPKLPEDPEVGHHHLVLAGRLSDEAQLPQSSSGGLTTFVLRRLLETNEIDGVVHVGRASGTSLFTYSVSRSTDELLAKRKSDYYSTTFADAIRSLRGDGNRYAVVGIPCFIKALRLVADEDPELGQQFKYFVGLLCGHLKSQFFAESLGWQVGIPPQDLESVDFRVKDPSSGSNRYDYSATAHGDDEPRLRKVSTTIDGNWGYAAFQPEGCNFCDDIFAETADVVFGDAWLPEYTNDWRGTNVVVSRSEVISTILQVGMDDGSLQCDVISPEHAARSQAGNFRHRRDGLSVRLADDQSVGLPVPKKRFAPGYSHVTRRRLRVIRQRRDLSRLSLEAFAEAKERNEYGVYVAAMQPAKRRYDLFTAADRGGVALLKHMAKLILRRR